jgi:hypothetical protein
MLPQVDVDVKRRAQRRYAGVPMSPSPASLVVVIGRAEDCDLRLEEPSISGHHARLSWSARRIVVEDLGSANGLFVAGQRVPRALVRPGDDVRLGAAPLPWSDPRLRAFLRGGARGDTMVGVRRPGRAFTCGACGAGGMLPPGASGKQIRCGACGETLSLERGEGGGGALAWAGVGALFVVALLVTGAAWWAFRNPKAARETLAVTAPTVLPAIAPERDAGPPAASPEEAAIRAQVAANVARAVDVSAPATRSLAVRVASTAQGTFRVEQVAQLWTYVRGRWKYVNDPRGREYFATASETIGNEFAGDCDDFAITLVALVGAIGGDARLVMMDGPEGGHAYAEACIPDTPSTVASRLKRHYERSWDRYLGRQRVRNIHFRADAKCPVWLNLDWSAGVPGGPYTDERWAVAVRPDASTETLGAAGSPAARASAASSHVQTAALPPR